MYKYIHARMCLETWSHLKAVCVALTGILNAMSLVGPALAFVGGGLMLNIFVDFYVLSPDE